MAKRLDLATILTHLANVDATDNSWRNDAACRGMPADLFMPPRGDNTIVKHAKQVCDTCPVKWNCLRYGLIEKYGVWGGQAESNRRTINAAWNRAQRAAS